MIAVVVIYYFYYLITIASREIAQCVNAITHTPYGKFSIGIY